jgi:hypothetical protein
MKNSITLVMIVSSMILVTTVSAQEDEKKVKSSTTTTTTITQETQTNDNQAKPAEESQNEESSSEWKGFHIGGVLQATFTDVKVDGSNGTVNTSYVVGYGGGGFIGYFFNSHVEVRAEALYSSLAQELEENDVKRKLELSYINFPLLLGLHTGYDKPVNLNITFGPQVGINTGSSLEGSGSDGIDTVQASINVKPADLGIAYGAGLDFGFGPERLIHLNVGFRGVYGLIDISDDSKNTTTNNYYVLDRAHLKTYSGYAGLSVKF